MVRFTLITKSLRESSKYKFKTTSDMDLAAETISGFGEEKEKEKTSQIFSNKVFDAGLEFAQS